MSKNKEIAKVLFELADALEIQGVRWKPNAFRRAARFLEKFSEPIEKVAKEGTKALKDLPTIGEGIAGMILEYLETGKVKELDEALKGIPKGADELLHVPGLGPKKAVKLQKELKIKSVKGLERAAKRGKVRELEGFGAKSESEILEGIELLKLGNKRRRLGSVISFAKGFQEYLSKLSYVKRAVVAGSVRRGKETVKDVDVLVLSDKPDQVMDAVKSFDDVKKVVASGSTKTSVIMSDGLQVDVRVLDKRSFGAGLQYFTGSKEHNVKLRQIAIKKGFKLSEYGLFKGDKYVCSRSEKDIYKKLGLQFIPPEIRQNTGEIEAASKKHIPSLLEQKDLKGDLHMHTKWSDGNNTIEEMAKAAEQLGYDYIALTDHSKSQHIANGLDENRLLEYIKTIDKVQKKVKIKLLKGSEVDILSDGSLDYDDKYLKKLDVVVASVHSGFKSSKAKMTKRILRALENPYVNVLGHPTGRLIHQRNPFEFDLKKVFESAKVNGVALEINSSPKRLDLKTEHARLAAEMGCKVAVNTDSHAVDHLPFIELGIAGARRGWTKKVDVINTFSLSKLQKFLNKKS